MPQLMFLRTGLWYVHMYIQPSGKNDLLSISIFCPFAAATSSINSTYRKKQTASLSSFENLFEKTFLCLNFFSYRTKKRRHTRGHIVCILKRLQLTKLDLFFFCYHFHILKKNTAINFFTKSVPKNSHEDFLSI
jgi:hypothetical protein